MSGSGVRIAMEVTAVVHRLILRDQVVALFASCVAVVGSTSRGTVVSLIVTTTVLVSVAASTASASPVPLSFRLKAT